MHRLLSAGCMIDFVFSDAGYEPDTYACKGSFILIVWRRKNEYRIAVRRIGKTSVAVIK